MPSSSRGGLRYSFVKYQPQSAGDPSGGGHGVNPTALSGTPGQHAASVLPAAHQITTGPRGAAGYGPATVIRPATVRVGLGRGAVPLGAQGAAVTVQAAHQAALSG